MTTKLAGRGGYGLSDLTTSGGTFFAASPILIGQVRGADFFLCPKIQKRYFKYFNFFDVY